MFDENNQEIQQDPVAPEAEPQPSEGETTQPVDESTQDTQAEGETNQPETEVVDG